MTKAQQLAAVLLGMSEVALVEWLNALDIETLDYIYHEADAITGGALSS